MQTVLEREVNTIMEEMPQDAQEEEKIGSIRHWVEENFRLIISMVIVIALGAIIYSYSQRAKESTVVFNNNETPTQEQVLVDDQEDSQNSHEDSTEVSTAPTEDSKSEESPKEEPIKPETTSMETSKETSDAFVAVAVKGNGMTHLARRALADYLAKNPDSQLTPAHKIYIEDALRKSVSHTGGVHVGTEVSFSKDLIQNTIGQSKTLSEQQLNNLQKYVVLVPSLS